MCRKDKKKVIKDGMRDNRISNIKGILIILVVFGHVLEADKARYINVYEYIYSFHMPVFIFISGYLSKNINFKKIAKLILLYLPFQLFYCIFLFTIGYKEVLDIKFLIPQYQLWYLISMVWWYLIAMMLSKISNKNLKIVAGILIVALGIISRKLIILDDTYILSYQRTLSFVPFYLAGYFLVKENIEYLFNLFGKYKKIISTSIIALVFIFIVILNIKYTNGLDLLFRGSFDLRRLDYNISYGIMMAIAYLIPTLSLVAIMNVVSSRKSLLTKFGDNSLLVFLLHPIFTLTIGGVFEGLGVESNIIMLFVYFIVSIAIVYIIVGIQSKLKKTTKG